MFGVCVRVCVFLSLCVYARSTKAPAGTRAQVETSKIVRNSCHGLVVSGGAAAVLRGVDVSQNARAGVLVLREKSITHTHTLSLSHTHTHIHTHIYAYIRTYVHTYIRIYIHTYIHTTYIHTYKYIYTNIRTGIFVVHQDSFCDLDTCRVSDNAWHGVYLHAEFRAHPKGIKVKRSVYIYVSIF